MKFLAGCVCVLGCAVLGQGVDFGGQVRTRTEMNKKSFESDQDMPVHTQLRTRLAADMQPSEWADLRLEVQDSRIFGGEIPSGANPATATVASGAGSLDLHQGYAMLHLGPLDAKLGRQKMALGAQRFISSLEWHPNARVFDGLSASWKPDSASRLTGLVFEVRNPSATAIEANLVLWGLHYARSMSEALNFETYVFYERLRPTPGYDYIYPGARVYGRTGMLRYEEEFIWQAGELGGTTKAAFYNATRLGAAWSAHGAVTAGFDMMSGDASGKMETNYNANYFFSHAYFGWMDYFLATPSTGIVDIRLDVDLPLYRNVVLKSQNHYFLPADAPSNKDDPYGWEFDLEIHCQAVPKTNFVLGGAVFLPGKGMTYLASGPGGGADDSAGLFFYFMPIFNF